MTYQGSDRRAAERRRAMHRKRFQARGAIRRGWPIIEALAIIWGASVVLAVVLGAIALAARQ